MIMSVMPLLLHWYLLTFFMTKDFKYPKGEEKA